jgi:hypothetical protein
MQPLYLQPEISQNPGKYRAMLCAPVFFGVSGHRFKAQIAFGGPVSRFLSYKQLGKLTRPTYRISLKEL